jgi:hypothetical protein
MRNPLHCAGADADFAGNFVDAFTCAQLSLDALFNLFAYARPTTAIKGTERAGGRFRPCSLPRCAYRRRRRKVNALVRVGGCALA